VDYGNVLVYTPSPLAASQEFLVVERYAVPAPANSTWLVAGFLGLLGFARRRARR
jgi:hypothetical protein